MMICNHEVRFTTRLSSNWHTTESAQSPRCFHLFMLSAHTDILDPRSDKNTTKVITICHTFAKSQSCAYFYPLASGPMADWAMCVPVDWTKPVVKPCFLSFPFFLVQLNVWPQRTRQSLPGSAQKDIWKSILFTTGESSLRLRWMFQTGIHKINQVIIEVDFRVSAHFH